MSLCLKLLGIHPSHLNHNKWTLSMSEHLLAGQYNQHHSAFLKNWCCAVLYLMKQTAGHVYRKSVSQWVQYDSHNCFILTIKKRLHQPRRNKYLWKREFLTSFWPESRASEMIWPSHGEGRWENSFFDMKGSLTGMALIWVKEIKMKTKTKKPRWFSLHNF